MHLCSQFQEAEIEVVRAVPCGPAAEGWEGSRGGGQQEQQSLQQGCPLCQLGSVTLMQH